MTSSGIANRERQLQQGDPGDLSAFWMPFTANRRFKAAPRLLTSADGMYYGSSDGRRILDGTAGLWCVNAGHRRKRISEAVARQIDLLDYAPPFQMAHPIAFELAARLAAMMPGELNHAFFTNSGSEAVDTALKIALAYHRARGQAGRTRLIGRERAYHGVGFGGISVGGIASNRSSFGPLLTGVDHLAHTHDLGHQAFSRGQPSWGAHLADDLERIVALHDPSTIAAVIIEPMAGSTGVLVPPAGYLERIRAITERYGILLIFDEVITAFGRLGAASAADYFGVTPDMMTVAKGLTNGAVPMGAVLVSDPIFDTFMSAPGSGIELFHGYTYSAHPVACAAALATLDIYADERLFERAAGVAGVWEDAVHSLKGRPHVCDIRNIGLVAAIELEPRANAQGERAYDVFVDCFRSGALIRVTGDTIALSPPLIISEAEIATLVEIVAASIQTVQ